MDHLLEPQIRESCRLALPEGLKDLMADISREVLRAQPQDLYQFIADYLSVLLVAREHLFIASRVCDDLCKNRCRHDLEDELRRLSLSEEDVQKSLEIVMEYFTSDQVKEGNLLQKLMQKTDIGVKELSDVQEAVRRAFLRYQLNETSTDTPPSEDDELDEIARAAKHTLSIYEKATKNPDLNYDCVASKIQTAYRAYVVRRKRRVPSKKDEPVKRVTVDKVRFHVKSPVPDFMKVKSCPSICSDMSLAGSLMSFDSYRLGASKHQSDVADDGVAEKKETLDVEYIANALRSELTTQSHDAITQKAKKTISFHGPPDVAVVNNDASEEESEADYESQRFDGQDSDEEVKKNRVNSESVLEEHSGDSNLVSETNDIWADQVDIENNMQAESNSEGQSTDTNENVIEKNVIDNTILENCSIGLSKSLPSLVINKIISVSKVEDETNEVELENQIELSETESIPEELVNDVVDDGVFNDEVVDEAYNDEISDEM